MKWLSVACALSIASSSWAGKTVTIAFEGDNGGEISPCGCGSNPTGGLARRKTIFDQWKNPLVIDSGNALFPNAGVATEEDQKRAKLVFGVMEDLNTRVMIVGQRDLSAGTAFLEALAKGKKLKLLSANLMRDGKRVFDASTVIDVNGVKVALVGLTMPGPVAPNEKNVAALPTIDAAKAAIAALPARDVTVLVAATSYADAMQLSVELKDKVDFVIQSGEFRGTQPPQRVDDSAAVLLASAQKGQALAKLELDLGKGKGPFFDLTIVDRDKQQVAFIGEQIKTIEERIALAKDAKAIEQLKSTLVTFKQRRAELEASVAKKSPPGAKTMQFGWTLLGKDVADDPKIKARVMAVDPAYTGVAH